MLYILGPTVLRLGFDTKQNRPYVDFQVQPILGISFEHLAVRFEEPVITW